mgnify:FL=1
MPSAAALLHAGSYAATARRGGRCEAIKCALEGSSGAGRLDTAIVYWRTGSVASSALLGNGFCLRQRKERFDRSNKL